MKRKVKVSRLGSLLLAVVCLTLAPIAQAAFINGTMGFVPFGANPTFTGPDLGHATSFTVPALEFVNSTLPDPYLGNPNSFNSGPSTVPLASLVTMSTLTLTFPQGPIAGYVSVSSGTTPADRYVFDMTSLLVTHSSDNDLELQAKGVLSDTSGFYSPTAAKLSSSWTTTGPGASVNGSFTLEAMNTSVPETGSALFGLAPIGMLFLARFRNRK